MSTLNYLLKDVDVIEIHRVRNGYELFIEQMRPDVPSVARRPFVFKDIYDIVTFLTSQGFDELEVNPSPI